MLVLLENLLKGDEKIDDQKIANPADKYFKSMINVEEQRAKYFQGKFFNTFSRGLGKTPTSNKGEELCNNC